MFLGGGRLAWFVFACVFGNGFWFWNGKERLFLKFSRGQYTAKTRRWCGLVEVIDNLKIDQDASVIIL